MASPIVRYGSQAAEVGDGPMGFDRVDAGEDRVTCALGEQMHPEDPAAVAFGDELDDPARVAADDRPRHILQAEHAAFALDALFERLGLRETGRGDRGLVKVILGIAE